MSTEGEANAQVDAGSRFVMADELLRMPEIHERYELARGRVIARPFAFMRTSVVSARVGTRISRYADDHKLGLCTSAKGGMRLERDPDTVLAPSLAFIAAERIRAIGIPDGFWSGAPDLAMEVLMSSLSSFSYVMGRVRLYLQAGSRLAWMVDPEARAATVFRCNGAPSVINADGVLDGEDVLPGLRLELREVWV